METVKRSIRQRYFKLSTFRHRRMASRVMPNPDSHRDIIDTVVFNFVKEFYESFLGEELYDEDILNWFNKPWLLKDRIQNLSDNLKLLRIAFEQIDTSA